MFRPRSLCTLILMLLFCLPPPACFADTQTLHIFNFDFGTADHTHLDPTINLGDTVHWVWDSGFHSTTSVEGLSESWDSGTHLPGTPAFTFDHTFTHSGTFTYYCTVHGFDNGDGTALGMSGSILVRPAAVPAPGSLLTFAVLFVLGGTGLKRRRSASHSEPKKSE